MDTAFLARVDAWLLAHRQEIIDDLVALVGVPSVSEPGSAIPPFGQPCRDVLRHMFALGERHGYSTRNYDDYIGAITFCEGARSIGFWGHLDVVPVPDPDAWDFPPFEATVVEDRYIIGRGVQDNKAPVIGVFHVMNCLRDLGIPLRHGYALYMGTNEECGMEDVRYFVDHYPCPDLSIVPDSGFPVCCAQRGAMTVRLSIPFPHDVRIEMHNNPSVLPETMTATLPDGRTITKAGNSAHVYNAEGKRNAIPAMLAALATAFPAEGARLGMLGSLVGQTDGAALHMAATDDFSGPLILAPTRMAVADDQLHVDVFAILPVSADGEALARSGAEACAPHGISLSMLRLRRPCSFPREHPVVPLLTGVYNEVMGTDSEPFAMSGGNYAALLPRAFGFGPGMPGRSFPPHIFRDGHGDYHQCDESEDIDHLLSFMRIYAMSIVALDQLDIESGDIRNA